MVTDGTSQYTIDLQYYVRFTDRVLWFNNIINNIEVT